MARPILQLEATEEEILVLGRLVRGIKVSVGDRFNATIVLHRLAGMSETEVARTIGCSLGSVCKWSKRFDGYGIAGLRDAPGRGRKAVLPTEKSLRSLNEPLGLCEVESDGACAPWRAKPG